MKLGFSGVMTFLFCLPSTHISLVFTFHTSMPVFVGISAGVVWLPTSQAI